MTSTNRVIIPPMNEASEHSQLWKAARLDGQDDAPLREILWLTNAHYKLVGLPRVAATLSGILIERAAAWSDILAKVIQNSDERIQSWINALLWVQRYSALEISRPIASLHIHPESAARSLNPIHGHLSQRHPLYTTLWETDAFFPDEPPRKSSIHARKFLPRGPLESPLSSASELNQVHRLYRLLVGHVTMGHIVLFASNCSRETYEGYLGVAERTPKHRKLYDILLSLRGLMPLDRFAIRYLKGLNAAEDPIKFLELNLNPGRAAKIFPGKHRDIMSFLKVALNAKSWATRSFSSRESRVGGWWIPDKEALGKHTYVGTIQVGDADDPSSNSGTIETISHIGGDDRARRAALAEDDDPMDKDVDDTTVFTPPSGEDGVSGANIGWAQVCHLEMHNQFLHWDWEALSIGEIWSLLQTVKKFERDKRNRYTSRESRCLLTDIAMSETAACKLLKTSGLHELLSDCLAFRRSRSRLRYPRQSDI